MPLDFTMADLERQGILTDEAVAAIQADVDALDADMPDGRKVGREIIEMFRGYDHDFLGTTRIGRALGFHKRTVARRLVLLKGKGLLAVVNVGGRERYQKTDKMMEYLRITALKQSMTPPCTKRPISATLPSKNENARGVFRSERSPRANCGF